MDVIALAYNSAFGECVLIQLSRGDNSLGFIPSPCEVCTIGRAVTPYQVSPRIWKFFSVPCSGSHDEENAKFYRAVFLI